MIFDETYTLSNGVEIPKLGLGTWFIDDGDAAEAVRQAARIGYRHFDTAQAYGNERGVGEGIRTCGVPREKLFVTDKIAAEHKSYASAVGSIDGALEKMKLDYLDMMIIHSPQPWAEWRGKKRYFKENREVWKALEGAYRAGKVRAIGVSNFLQDDLTNLFPACEVKPMVNQILAHIGNTPLPLIDFCTAKGVLVESYAPIAHGEIFKDQTAADMAGKYGVSLPQLCVRYVLQLGTVALPKTANPEHMRQNASVDFKISDGDMKFLKSLTTLKDYGQFSHFPVFSGK